MPLVDPRPTAAAHVAFGFDGPLVVPYRAESGRVDRLSFVAWAVAPDDPSPLFFGSELRARTLVVQWRGDRYGQIDRDEFAASAVRVLELSAAQFEQLRVVHRDFHLGRHDVRVVQAEPLLFAPCRDSLWAARDRFPALRARVRAALDALASAASPAGTCIRPTP